MITIGINTHVYMTELANGTPQSNLLPIIASHGITLAKSAANTSPRTPNST